MLNRSKLIIAAIAVAACVSGSVNARETGIINQAGPYEQTMQFYLHPAHGFPGKSETQERRHAAMPVEAKSKQTAASKTSVPGFAVKTVSTQPALPSSNAQAAKRQAGSAPLTLYIEDSAGKSFRLVRVPGVGWQYAYDGKSGKPVDKAMLVKTASSTTEQSAGAPLTRGDALTVFIDGPSGFTYVWIRDEGWKFAGHLSHANR